MHMQRVTYTIKNKSILTRRNMFAARRIIQKHKRKSVFYFIIIYIKHLLSVRPSLIITYPQKQLSHHVHAPTQPILELIIPS